MTIHGHAAPAHSVVDAIRQWAVQTPHHLALADGATTFDFQALCIAIDTTAERFYDAGIQPGDRVGTALPDGAEAVISSLAALACGGVHVPIDHHLTVTENRDLLSATGIRFLVDDKGIHDLASPRTADPLGAGVSAFLRFTSGTTGNAKGVLLSHATLLTRAEAAARTLELQPGNRVLWLLPLAYHWAASVIAALVAGAGIVFGNRLRLRDTLAEAHTHSTTLAYASPWHCQRFATCPIGELKPVHTLICTTAPLARPIADQLRLHHGIRLRQALGVIECGLPLISAGTDDHSDGSEAGEVGFPQPGFSCRLRDVADDGSGELLISGPGLFDAYLHPWTPAQQVLVDGHFCTGDRAVILPDGRIRILGRLKDLINVGGMKVFPQEIEATVASHPAVVASHAYAVPDQRLGETVGITVELQAQFTADARDRFARELREWCRAHLAPLKQPTVWVFAPIARTASGKTRRHAEPSTAKPTDR